MRQIFSAGSSAVNRAKLPSDVIEQNTSFFISFASELNHITYFADLQVEFESLDIGDVIGEGRFGKVFKALWSFSPVAVKQMKIGSVRSFKEITIVS